MDLSFTWFDFAAVAVLGLSGVMAFARGLIREIFSIIAFIGALLAALFFADMLRPTVEQFTPLSGALASVAAGLLIFVVIFIIITVVASTLAKRTHQSTEIGSFDRAAGLAFGVLRGVIVVALFVLLIRQGVPDTETGPWCTSEPTAEAVQDGVRAARTCPIYESVSRGLEAMRFGQRARDIIDNQRGESAPIPPPAQDQAPAPAP